MKKFSLLLAVVLGCSLSVKAERKPMSLQAAAAEMEYGKNVKYLPTGSTGLRVKGWIHKAGDKMQELHKWILDQENMVMRAKFTQEAMRGHRKEIALHVKSVSDEVRKYLDNAEKQAELEAR